MALAGNTSILLQNNHLENNKALMGGCLFIGDSATPHTLSTSFRRCKTTSGGAIAINGYSLPRFDDCTISECIADSVGSGVLVEAFSTPIFTNSQFLFVFFFMLFQMSNAVTGIIIHPMKVQRCIYKIVHIVGYGM